ncbi:hypothetical protein [Pantoea ananatis]|uniref:hypothetical protein n=1 Tax=Pantoea ananas TaxID=553 RepID=UPI0023AEB740|nr:hypothetical protein [Pantoea ananatis]
MKTVVAPTGFAAALPALRLKTVWINISNCFCKFRKDVLIYAIPGRVIFAFNRSGTGHKMDD